MSENKSDNIKPKEGDSSQARKEEHPLEKSTVAYLKAIREISETAGLVIPHTHKWLLSEFDKNYKKLQRFLPTEQGADGKRNLILKSARDYAEFSEVSRKHDEIRSNKALRVLFRSLFMQLFSEFDAFTGNSLKVIYLKNDKLLKGISREI